MLARSQETVAAHGRNREGGLTVSRSRTVVRGPEGQTAGGNSGVAARSRGHRAEAEEARPLEAVAVASGDGGLRSWAASEGPEEATGRLNRGGPQADGSRRDLRESRERRSGGGRWRRSSRPVGLRVVAGRFSGAGVTGKLASSIVARRRTAIGAVSVDSGFGTGV